MTGRKMSQGEVRMKIWFSFILSIQIKLWESDARQFIVSVFEHGTIWGKVSWYSTISSAQRGIINYIKTQLKVQVPSSRKMCSRDRLWISLRA